MQRYFAVLKKDNNFTLNNDDWYHIKTVMRMSAGDKIEVVYQHEVYICRVTAIDTVEIIEKEEITIDKKVEITLIVPLLKEAKMDLILQKSTELGVDKIIPVITNRSIVKFDSSKEEKKLLRWNKIVKEASEQSKRVDIPVITRVKKMNELEEITGLKLVCSTTEKENTLNKVLRENPNEDKITFLIGPEGGLTKFEEDLLVSIGFEKITLGKLIMRVETVPLFVLSILNYEKVE